MRGKQSKIKGLYLIMILVILVSTGCQQNAPIKIGVVATLEGENSKLSSSSINGLDLAIDEVNQAGGINGRSIELVIKDTEGYDEKAIKLDQNFFEDNIKIVIGPFTSGMVTRTIEYVNSEEMLVISPTASVDTLKEKDDHYLRFIGSASDEAVALSDAALVLGDQSFVIVYDETNTGFADELALDFKTEIETKMHGDVKQVAIDPDKMETVEIALATIREEKPQGVLFVTNARTSAIMAEKIEVLNSDIQLYSSMWANTDELVKMGSIYVNGMVVVSGENLSEPLEAYKHFKEIYKERYGEAPDYAAVYSYDAMKALIEAMSASDTFEPMTIKSKILEISRYEGLQGNYSIDAYGDVSRTYNTFKLKKGELVPLE